MSYKILRATGWFIHRGTVRAWTPEEESNPVLQQKQKEFMDRIFDNLGRVAPPTDFPRADLTSDFPYYAGGIEDGFTGNPDKIEDLELPTPEAQDNYVGVSLELPRGGRFGTR